jgi:hypothetical protein
MAQLTGTLPLLLPIKPKDQAEDHAEDHTKDHTEDPTEDHTEQMGQIEQQHWLGMPLQSLTQLSLSEQYMPLQLEPPDEPKTLKRRQRPRLCTSLYMTPSPPLPQESMSELYMHLQPEPPAKPKNLKQQQRPRQQPCTYQDLTPSSPLPQDLTSEASEVLELSTSLQPKPPDEPNKLKRRQRKRTRCLLKFQMHRIPATVYENEELQDDELQGDELKYDEASMRKRSPTLFFSLV